MSLTSCLADTNSEIYKFFKGRLPNTRRLVTERNRQIGDAKTIKPSVPTSRWEYGMLGRAIDYRIRYFFANTDCEDLVAYEGAALLTPDSRIMRIDSEHDSTTDPLGVFTEPSYVTTGTDLQYTSLESGLTPWEEIKNRNWPELKWLILETKEGQAPDDLIPAQAITGFFRNLKEFLETTTPWTHHLAERDEKILARYCVILSLFEECFRTGATHDSILTTRQPSSPEELLNIAQQHWIDDLAEMSRRFGAFLKVKPYQTAILNPTFAGSGYVGGADADLILDSQMIDIKASIHPKIQGPWLYQTLGYALLDYTSEYRIDSIGIYMARQGLLVEWDADDLVKQLSGKTDLTLESLRKDFQQEILTDQD